MPDPNSFELPHMIISASPPPEMDLDNSTSYTFALVGGAFNASHWEPFGRFLVAAGHDVIHPELPSDDPTATFEDDTEAVRQAIKGHKNVALLTSSRGFETTRLLETADLDQFVSLVAVSSGGPHFYQLDPALPEAAQSRYKPEYLQVIKLLGGNLCAIDPQDARRLFYHDVENHLLVDAVLKGLRVQRTAIDDASPAYMLPTGELPTKVFLGENDRILNIGRACRVFKEWVDLEAELLPAGHFPNLSMISYLARRVIDFTNRAHKRTLAD